MAPQLYAIGRTMKGLKILDVTLWIAVPRTKKKKWQSRNGRHRQTALQTYLQIGSPEPPCVRAWAVYILNAAHFAKQHMFPLPFGGDIGYCAKTTV